MNPSGSVDSRTAPRLSPQVLYSALTASSPAARYLAAGALGALALLAMSATDRLEQGVVLLLLYPVVTVAAAFGGLGPGLLTTAFAVLGVTLLSPAETPDALHLSAFALNAALVSGLFALLRRSCGQAKQQHAESSAYASKLHLQLLLAEKEIERLRISASDPRVSVPAVAVMPPVEAEALEAEVVDPSPVANPGD